MPLTAFQTSATPPLVIAASLDRDEVLAGWRREARGAGIVLVGAALTLLAMLAYLFRQMDAKARAERALTEARQLEAARLHEANDRLADALAREQIARRDAEAASALKDEFRRGRVLPPRPQAGRSPTLVAAVVAVWTEALHA